MRSYRGLVGGDVRCMEDELAPLTPSVAYATATSDEINTTMQRMDDRHLGAMLLYNASKETYCEYWRGLENDFSHETKDRYPQNMIETYKKLHN